MNKEPNNTYWDGADGMYDDGPITPVWSEDTPKPKTPEKKPESGWDSLSDYARKYNESMRDKMYANYSAMSEGYLDAEEAAVAKAAAAAKAAEATAAAAEAEDKVKMVGGRSWAKMVHWYRNHPSELTDIMYVGAEYDEDWYRKHPEAIADLTRDYLAKERELAAQIMAENDGLIDEKSAIEAARRQLNDEYIKSIKKAPGDGYMGDPGDKPDKDSKTSAAGEGAKEGDETKSEKVSIGDIELDKMVKAIDKKEAEKLATIEKNLDELLPDLAELYARNRRLIAGRENIAKFAEIKAKYGNMLNEYLRLKANKTYGEQTKEIGVKIESRIEELQNEIKAKLLDFAGGDLEKPTKTQAELDAKKAELIDEANRILTTEYGEKIKAIKAEVNAGMIKDLLEHQIKMEDATINALDNGSPLRKAVHKIIDNKYLKTILIAAGAVGLIVATAGVATGAVAIGVSYTAGGIALGAAKGGLSGALMSRQDSKHSAIRGFSNEAALQEQFKKIDLLTEGDDSTANVAKWIMSEYSKANKSDLNSNRKKTAISVGIGAIVGGALSGVHFTNTVEAQPAPDASGAIPEETTPQMPDVFHKEGTGMNELFREMGGQGDLPEEILQELSSEFGLELGKPGWTFPGSVSSWPAQNQAMAEALFQKCIARGWISPVVTPTQTVFNAATQASTDTVPNQFYNFIARGLQYIIPAGVGGMMGGFNERTRSERPTGSTSVSGTTTESTAKPEPETTTKPEPAPESTTADSASETTVEPKSTTESTTKPEPTETTSASAIIEGLSDDEKKIAEEVLKAKDKYNNSLRLILENSSEMLGGKENIEKFFRGDTAEYGEYYNYWNSLSSEDQEAARAILGVIPNSGGKWDLGGVKFKKWLNAYDRASSISA